MSIRCEKPWIPAADLSGVFGHMGVFQLSNAAGEVIFIGFAGGRSRFGLGGELRDALGRLDDATAYRYEINTAYRTRYQELLMIHVADHGELPQHNEPLEKLGRLSPA